MSRLSTVSGLIGELTSRFQNLETGFAARTIYEVWTDICVDTEAWRISLTNDTVVGQQDFTLVVPVNIGADILRINQVVLLGGPQSPDRFWFTPPSGLHLQYSASIAQTGGLVTIVTLSPWLNDMKGINNDLFAIWYKAIYEGCVAKLSAMQSKMAWFDPQLSKDSLFRYNGHKGKIRMDTETGNTSMPLHNWSTIPWTDL